MISTKHFQDLNCSLVKPMNEKLTIIFKKCKKISILILILLYLINMVIMRGHFVY